jgi:hypothetical protein
MNSTELVSKLEYEYIPPPKKKTKIVYNMYDVMYIVHIYLEVKGKVLPVLN